jgi:nitroreductase
MAADRVWYELVERARWAPSPHNTQPWRIAVISEDEAELHVPVDRLLPVEDPDGRFMTAGMGLFLEALDVAAAARGRALEWECFYPDLGAGASESSLFARLALPPRTRPSSFPADLLERRRTSRLPYDGRPAPESALEVLSAEAAELGHWAAFTSESDLVDWVVSLNADTVFYDLAEDDRRREIGAWTHPDDDAAGVRGDGFSPSCVGFHPALVRTFFDAPWLFRPPLVRAVARRLYLRSMRGTATVGWIKGPWRTPPEWLAAGRMLLRFWLAATAHGLYLQPFGSVITNPKAHARLAERLEVEEGDRELWLLLRIGYSAEPPRSARRSAGEIVA